jgi:putative intracellular protease/amidase
MVTSTSDKNILIILSNEAFLPRTGAGRFTPELATWTTIHEPSSSRHRPRRSQPRHGEKPPRREDEEDEGEEEEDTGPSAEEFHREHKLTGVDAYELVHMWVAFYQYLKCSVTIASPRGGPVAMDPYSQQMLESEEKLRVKIKSDTEFWRKVTHTIPLSWINPRQYDLVLVPGSHAALYDLVEDKHVSRTIAEVYCNRGYLAAIGHGVASLLNVRYKPPKTKKSDRTSTSSEYEYLLSNKRCCCPTKEEEKKSKVDEFLPYFLEEKLESRNAEIENRDAFAANVVNDERIITAQNTASTKKFIQTIVECLGFSKEHIKDILN